MSTYAMENERLVALANELGNFFSLRNYDLEDIKYFLTRAYLIGMEEGWMETKELLEEAE